VQIARFDGHDVQKGLKMYVRELPEGECMAAKKAAPQVGGSTEALFEIALAKWFGPGSGRGYS